MDQYSIIHLSTPVGAFYIQLDEQMSCIAREAPHDINKYTMLLDAIESLAIRKINDVANNRRSLGILFTSEHMRIIANPPFAIYKCIAEEHTVQIALTTAGIELIGEHLEDALLDLEEEEEKVSECVLE